MASETQILGVILAGGRAVRFGGAPKGLALLNGQPIISYIIESLEKHTRRIGVSVSARNAGDYAGLGLAMVLDHADYADRGPLSGLLAALNWAASHQARALLVAPCDAPFLTPKVWSDLLHLLDASGAMAAIAASPSETHPLCAALRPSLARELKTYLDDPTARLAVRAFLNGVHIETLDLKDEAQFLNINSQEDLAQAEAVFASRDRRS